MKDSSKKREIVMIAAASKNDVLGKDNKLIWHLPDDLKRFKKLTLGHAVIMGRKTYESMPAALPNRKNIVVTRNPTYTLHDALVCHTLTAALNLAKEDMQPFIIGGGEMYREGLAYANKIELTRIHHDFEGDAFFPEIDEKKWRIESTEHFYKTDTVPYDYSYITYLRN